MSQSQDQPHPEQDWNDLSAREVEETLEAASELAYQLADDIGASAEAAPYRESPELAAIEGALDVELKQLEHLVDKTRLELDPQPAPAKPASSVSVPDFMSEFLTDEPVPVMPLAGAESPDASSTALHSAEVAAAPQKPGLVGVGTLGQADRKKLAASPRPQPVELPASESKSFADHLESPIYKACCGIARLLEILDTPFARLNPTARRALSVTALAAFGACLGVFLASLLFN